MNLRVPFSSLPMNWMGLMLTRRSCLQDLPCSHYYSSPVLIYDIKIISNFHLFTLWTCHSLLPLQKRSESWNEQSLLSTGPHGDQFADLVIVFVLHFHVTSLERLDPSHRNVLCFDPTISSTNPGFRSVSLLASFRGSKA